ncbi:MAG: sugar O-acetyltransferase [Erysipelotrichaceae bacterium]|nr:sugar O-acetyltransferase [Erysipelotrichaceae bacterium]MDY5252067.1 sugar O-acetyltransferase [Erysipelotrichaceae bacterium]
MKQNERMVQGYLYHYPSLDLKRTNANREKMWAFNHSNHNGDITLLQDVINMQEDVMIIPPLYFDHGFNIEVGSHFFANTNTTILDGAKVKFGDNVFIGPNCGFYTASHPIDAKIRNMHLEYAKPITIGNDVWIGGHVCVMGGVTIDDNVIIGAGSVVTKDIPSGYIAAGNPCKLIRKITKEDKIYWEKQAATYFADADIKEGS